MDDHRSLVGAVVLGVIILMLFLTPECAKSGKKTPKTPPAAAQPAPAAPQGR